LDLSLVWEDDDGHWRAGLHGKNLADEEYKVAGYYFPAPTLGLEGSVTAFYGNPRTITGTVEYRFKDKASHAADTQFAAWQLGL